MSSSAAPVAGSAFIRELFTNFFVERGHRSIPSSSLIPAGDPTLLFTSAGMVPLKPYMMGLAAPPAPRLTSVQKCFRTTDIEEVGDGSHHTFFEMLGNFSIGDYFKDDVIPWAWQLLTTPQPQGLGLDSSRIWTTIYEQDEEAFGLWRKVGVPAERIVRYGEKDNYWFAGPVGPCGPNTEINYDFGVDQGCGRADCHPNCDAPMANGAPCSRFLELWNLVFMTLYQAEDGTRSDLPQKNVDTGAGLERWPSPLLWEGGVDWQGRPKRWTAPPTNYDSDLFQPILARIGDLAGFPYDHASEEQRRAMRVVAEHGRAATFLLADGVMPGNDGRGYVLRRLIRRAILYGLRLMRTTRSLPDDIGAGAQSVEELMARINRYDAISGARLERFKSGGPLLSAIVPSLVDLMGQYHPILVEQQSSVSRLLRSEEERSTETLVRGEAMLRQLTGLRSGIAELTRIAKDPSKEIGIFVTQGGFSPEIDRFVRHVRDSVAHGQMEVLTRLTGEEIFLLHDTYGFNSELTAELARESGLGLDTGGFEALMESQRERSRAAAHFEGDAERIQAYGSLGLPPTSFVGYESTAATATVTAIVAAAAPRDAVSASEDAVEVVLDRTPFYAEGGGQVGDRGELVATGGARLVVEDTQAVGEGGVVAHLGRLVEGSLRVGDAVEARVDEERRHDTMRNHTATHLLHAALRQVLGSHVRQAGSLVTPDRLRFDFTHLEALAPHQIAIVEALANEKVRANIEVHVEHQSYEDAIAGGALAFFGDKYADVVRVVSVCEVPSAPAHPEPVEGCFSRELCGGTHVHRSGDVGVIVITGESSIGAGMRRIEALTGRAAVEHLRRREEALAGLSALLRAPPDQLGARIEALQEEADSLRRRLQAAERRVAQVTASASTPGTGAGPAAETIGGVSVVVQRLEEAPNADFLRSVGDAYKSRLGEALILLAAVIDGKPAFLAMATPDVAKRCPAGDVVRVAAQAAGGGGGGRPELAQGGGSDPAKIDAALAAARQLIEAKLAPSTGSG